VKLSKADLEALCDALKAKALHEQMERRRWQQRAIAAESRLAIYEGTAE
jgi:Spy/CpxP family protein refolding chaperone